MKMYKLTGHIKYTDTRGNPEEWPFSYEVQCSSNHEEQRDLIKNKWLLDDAPLQVSSSDISKMDFKAVQLSDDEMSERYGAIQGGLGI